MAKKKSPYELRKEALEMLKGVEDQEKKACHELLKKYHKKAFENITIETIKNEAVKIFGPLPEKKNVGSSST